MGDERENELFRGRSSFVFDARHVDGCHVSAFLSVCLPPSLCFDGRRKVLRRLSLTRDDHSLPISVLLSVSLSLSECLWMYLCVPAILFLPLSVYVRGEMSEVERGQR